MYFIHRQLLKNCRENIGGLKTKHLNLPETYWFSSKAFTKISQRSLLWNKYSKLLLWKLGSWASLTLFQMVIPNYIYKKIKYIFRSDFSSRTKIIILLQLIYNIPSFTVELLISFSKWQVNKVKTKSLWNRQVTLMHFRVTTKKLPWSSSQITKVCNKGTF